MLVTSNIYSKSVCQPSTHGSNMSQDPGTIRINKVHIVTLFVMVQSCAKCKHLSTPYADLVVCMDLLQLRLRILHSLRRSSHSTVDFVARENLLQFTSRNVSMCSYSGHALYKWPCQRLPGPGRKYTMPKVPRSASMSVSLAEGNCNTTTKTNVRPVFLRYIVRQTFLDATKFHLLHEVRQCLCHEALSCHRVLEIWDPCIKIFCLATAAHHFSDLSLSSAVLPN